MIKEIVQEVTTYWWFYFFLLFIAFMLVGMTISLLFGLHGDFWGYPVWVILCKINFV